MNANELADEAEMWGKDLLALNMKGGIPVIECAKLVRQQQAEIEALKAHSVKELTDEEIIKTMVQFEVYSSDDQCLIDAGKAILRKAQEK